MAKVACFMAVLVPVRSWGHLMSVIAATSQLHKHVRRHAVRSFPNSASIFCLTLLNFNPEWCLIMNVTKRRQLDPGNQQ